MIINRNTEITLDIGDLEIEAPRYGQVLFAMSPSSASLYVDGNLVDTSLPVTLEYGIHQLMARAEGYSTVTSYLKVAEESAGIDITLDLEDDEEEEETMRPYPPAMASLPQATIRFMWMHRKGPSSMWMAIISVSVP